MHAPVVAQHYLVAMNNDTAIPMLDMAEYLKKYMSSGDLYQHIWKDQGGDSLDFFEKKILHKKPHPDQYVSLVHQSLRDADLSSCLGKLLLLYSRKIWPWTCVWIYSH